MRSLLYLFALLLVFAYTVLGFVPAPVDPSKAKLTLFNYAGSERCEIHKDSCESTPSVFAIWGVNTGDKSDYQFTYQSNSGRILSLSNSLYWDLRKAEPGTHVIHVKGYSAQDLSIKFQKNFTVRIRASKNPKKTKRISGRNVYAVNKERNRIINETFPLQAEEINVPKIHGIEFVTEKGTVPLCDSTTVADCTLIQTRLIVRPMFDQKKHARMIVGVSSGVGSVTRRGRSLIWDTSDVRPGTYKISLISLDATESTKRESKTFSVEITDKLFGPESRVVKNDTGEVFKTSESPLLDTKKHENNRPLIKTFSLSSSTVSNCSDKCVVKVTMTIVDPEDDPFWETFEVSAGKILRKNGEVFWDLTAATKGRHFIKACADDGSGCDNREDWKKLEIVVE